MMTITSIQRIGVHTTQTQTQAQTQTQTHVLKTIAHCRQSMAQRQAHDVDKTIAVIQTQNLQKWNIFSFSLARASYRASCARRH
jgi:hypothetical protein